jgi:hypothetical protein
MEKNVKLTKSSHLRVKAQSLKLAKTKIHIKFSAKINSSLMMRIKQHGKAHKTAQAGLDHKLLPRLSVIFSANCDVATFFTSSRSKSLSDANSFTFRVM